MLNNKIYNYFEPTIWYNANIYIGKKKQDLQKEEQYFSSQQPAKIHQTHTKTHFACLYKSKKTLKLTIVAFSMFKSTQPFTQILSGT